MLADLQGVSDHGQLIVFSSNLGLLSDPHVCFLARCERSGVALVHRILERSPFRTAIEQQIQ